MITNQRAIQHYIIHMSSLSPDQLNQIQKSMLISKEVIELITSARPNADEYIYFMRLSHFNNSELPEYTVLTQSMAMGNDILIHNPEHASTLIDLLTLNVDESAILNVMHSLLNSET